MQLGEVCNRDVIIATESCSVIEAAKLMYDYHVGSIIIVNKENEISKPIGIVTDRDLVINLLAENLLPQKVTIKELMNSKLITGKDTDQLWDSLNIMCTHGIRRMPVVDKDNCLLGIISADDIVELLSEQLQNLTRLIAIEQKKEVEQKLI